MKMGLNRVWIAQAKFFKKLLALERAFDIFSAPFCPEGKPAARGRARAVLPDGRSAWMQADN